MGNPAYPPHGDAPRRSRVLTFNRTPSDDLVLKRVLAAIKERRSLRPEYDQVHVAILQVLDRLRGVPRTPVPTRRTDVFRTFCELSLVAQVEVDRFILWRQRVAGRAGGTDAFIPRKRLEILQALNGLPDREQAAIADVVNWLSSRSAETQDEVRAAFEALAGLGRRSRGVQ